MILERRKKKQRLLYSPRLPCQAYVPLLDWGEFDATWQGALHWTFFKHLLSAPSSEWVCFPERVATALGLALLRIFFFLDIWRLCFLVAVVNVCFDWTCSGVTSHASSLLPLLFVDSWGWQSDQWGLISPLLFRLAFLQQLGMLCIYSCGGGLLF